MGELFAEGGHLFWVAPSGGRDRPDPETKQFVVAPFDVKSVDMFKVLALQSKKVSCYHPMKCSSHLYSPCTSSPWPCTLTS